MTYFLPDTEPQRVASGLTGGLPTGYDRFSAIWQSSSLSGGYRNFEGSRARESIANRTYDDAIRRLGGIERVTERMMEGREPFTPSRQALQEAVRGFVEEARQSDPDAWADMDLNPETFQRLANERLSMEMREYQDIIAMSPPNMAADFIAEAGSATLNVKTLPFLLLGGSGTFWSVVRREAAINAGVEAAMLPSQFQAAEDLGLEAPDPVRQIRDAAVFGAVFGGGFYAAGKALPVITDALARGLVHSRLRNSARIEGLPAVESEALTQRVEAALAEDRPFDRVREIFEEMVPVAPEPPPGMPPLILRPEERLPPTLPLEPSQRVDRPFGAEPVDTEVLPPAAAQVERPLDTVTLSSVVQGALRDAERVEAEATQRLTGGRKYPLLNALRRRGVRIDPDSPEGQELYSMGINSRTMPGLFRRPRPGEQQPPGLDNQVASELEDSFPGIWDATGTGRDQTYLDRGGLFDIIRREAGGDQSWQAAFEEVRIARENREALERAGDPQTDFLQKREPDLPDGLVIDRDLYEFAFTTMDADREIKRAVEGYLQERGFWDRLLPQERAEIVWQAQRNGGPVDYLVERAWERELEVIEASPLSDEMPSQMRDDLPGWDDEATPAGASGTTGGARQGDPPDAGPFPEQAGSGAASAGRGADDAFPVQRTDIGDQLLVPGTEVVQTGKAQRDRALVAAMQQQSRMRRGGQVRVEDDPGSLFGEAPRDLFSSPASPEARVVQDSVTADLRTAIERDGDLMVDMGDGKGERSITSVLDDLDQADAVSARMDLCGRAPGGDA